MITMKEEQIICLRQLFITQMNHWALFPIALVFLAFHSSVRISWFAGTWAICGLIPFFLFCVRRYTEHFIWLLISHGTIAIGMIIWNWAKGMENVLLLLLSAGYLICSVYLRLQRQNRQEEGIHPEAVVCIGAGSLFLQHYQGRTDWDSWCVVSVIAALALFLLQYFLEHYLRFLYTNEISTSHIPRKEIFTSGFRLTVLYTGVGTLLLLLTANLGWLPAMMQKLLAGSRFLVGLLPHSQGQEEIITQEGLEQQTQSLFPVTETIEPFWLWTVLENMVMAVFWLALLIVTVLGLKRLFYYLRERFSQKQKLQIQLIENRNEIRERCNIEKKKKENMSASLFLSKELRIRRIYRKRIWSQRKQLVKQSNWQQLQRQTARECGEKLGELALSEVYEKARYSNELCTVEDLRIAKGK